MGERRTLAKISALLRDGQPSQANELCDAFLVLQPEHAGALHLGGVMALNSGRSEVAISRLRRAAMLDPRNAAVLGDFARALQVGGFRADAETAYRATLSLDPAQSQKVLEASPSWSSGGVELRELTFGVLLGPSMLEGPCRSWQRKSTVWP